MRIIAVSALREFWTLPGKSKAEQPLKSWIAFTKKASWSNPVEVKETFNSADQLKGSRFIFDIKGNTFRIVAKINYRRQIVYIRFVGTHAEYDEIDPDLI